MKTTVTESLSSRDSASQASAGSTSTASPGRARRAKTARNVSGKRFPMRPHPHLFEINAWVWLDELSARLGHKVTLNSVPDEEWDRLKLLGFDIIYLMGIWTRSQQGRVVARTDRDLFGGYDSALPGWRISDVVGSAYSIQKYVLDPHIGAAKELKQVRDKLHSRGMSLFVDFVPNHTGLDHPWIASHPEYYVQGSLADFRANPTHFLLIDEHGAGKMPLFIARGRDPNFTPWADTAQLNYFNPELCRAMIGVLKTIAGAADGVRCDMAMLELTDIFQKTWNPLLSNWTRPLEEFWKTAIAQTPGLTFMAEAYSDTEFALQQLGFDYTYDKKIYDDVRDGNTQGVLSHLKGGWAFQAKTARFLENHDENRACHSFGPHRMPAVAALMGSLPGLRFYHQGQLEGKTLRIPVQLCRSQSESPHSEIKHAYERILTLTNHPAYHSHDWKLLSVQSAGDDSFQSVIAYVWSTKPTLRADGSVIPETRLVVVNLAGGVAMARMAMPTDFSVAAQWDFTDELSGESYVRDASDLTMHGMFVRLEGSAAHMFAVRPASALTAATAAIAGS